ncbi:thiamine phosphate synthase [Candidatus Sumerlaeota bacterium]|nr:thiamine phosphate synthase [Candidatus Sumerlaeota bacterium]
MPHVREFPKGPELYCITDARLSGLPHDVQASQMIAGGARIIQLRDKDIDDQAFLSAATSCQERCRAANALFVVNDRVEIAARINADALHLGQGDISPAKARAIVGNEMIIGVSTHDHAQFHRALDEPVNYIALGPVFGTTTKARPDPPPGMDLVREAAETLRHDPRPLVLIGGINADNIREVQDLAPNAILAVIGAIVSKTFSIEERVRLFRGIIHS